MRSKHRRSWPLSLASLGAALGATLALTTFALSGCSGDSGSGDELSGETPTPRASNPDGLAYPDEHLGLRARRGSVRGDRLANLAFRGHRGGGGSVEGALPDVLSMADYYDPELRRHRGLYVLGAAGWCAICRRVMGEIERNRESLESAGAAMVIVLVNGDSHGRGPSLADFDSWAERHPLPLDLGVDPGARQLASYGLEGVPFNMLIDPRTMEILTADVGEPNSLVGYVQAGLSFVANSPPSYP